MASPESTYSRAIALQQLARLRAVLRGAAPILRPVASLHTPPCSPEPRDHRGWCATVSPMVVVDNCPSQFLLVSCHSFPFYYFLFFIIIYYYLLLFIIIYYYLLLFRLKTTYHFVKPSLA
jgi:hypothetical protein